MDFNRGAGSLNEKDGRPLARQGSVYALTFDEFQNSMGGLGKDFGSMNMDELLKSIWTAEESQAMASALGGGEANQIAPGGGIQRQGSLTLPRTLSQKTVDEVWRDLVRENTSTTSTVPVAPPGDSHPRRQQTRGEMTLEEFLARAGVDINISNSVNNNNNINNINNTTNTNNNNNASSSGNNLFFGANFMGNDNNTHNNNNNNVAVMPMPIQSYGDQVVSLANGMMPGVIGMGGPIVGSPDGLGKGNGEMSSLSPVSYPFGGGLRGGKKNGPVEKVVERRQRRMIKNRESAARSRARKQAYTIELEAEVAKLKEQNEELQKKQAEIMEMQKKSVNGDNKPSVWAQEAVLAQNTNRPVVTYKKRK